MRVALKVGNERTASGKSRLHFWHMEKLSALSLGPIISVGDLLIVPALPLILVSTVTPSLHAEDNLRRASVQRLERVKSTNTIESGHISRRPSMSAYTESMRCGSGVESRM